VVTSAVLVSALLAFVAFTVDTGNIALTKARMQNAVDAAALAASQEIVSAVESAGEGEGSASGASAGAIAAARAKAVEVAASNDVFVDADLDVKFGRRSLNPSTGEWEILWDVEPYNVVKVSARREKDDTSLPDGRLKLFFGWAVGMTTAGLHTSAIAFVEARDIVVVLDYSGSMSFDSQFRAMSTGIGKAAVEANLDEIWDTLVLDDPKFSDTDRSKFPATGFGLVNSYQGTLLSEINGDPTIDDWTVVDALGLNAMDANGKLLYPFPQEGKYNDGTPKGEPGPSMSTTRWKDYVHWVRTNGNVSNNGYRDRYGYRTLAGFLIEMRPTNAASEDLWRTPHYPFHAMKEGVTRLTEFLTDLDFGDFLGLVTYDTSARWEEGLDDLSSGGYVDLEGTLITDNYAGIDQIQRHKQAGHYNSNTALGDGIKKARELLLSSHGRAGAKPTMVVLTDGNATVLPSGWSPPAGWNWNELTDYDHNGTADYSTSDSKKWYAFYEAKLSIDAGITIHTLALGENSDHDLMQAIAFAGSGAFVSVPGGASFAEVEEEVLAAFQQIAGRVPPPTLVNE